MRRAKIIASIVLFCAIVGVLAAWRPWEMTREQWIRETLVELRQSPPPPGDISTHLTAKLPDGVSEVMWAGAGYMIFEDGWARFIHHTFHSSERIGDVALLRASDGSIYVSRFHFCVG